MRLGPWFLLLFLALPAGAAEGIGFTVPCEDSVGTLLNQTVPVEIVYKRDARAGRLVVVGVAGGAFGSYSIKGVPGGCRFRLPRPLPGWPASEFCLDTVKLAAKEQVGLEYPSFLFVSTLEGFGRPTWSVTAGKPEHVESLCFDAADPPHLYLQNSWNQPQVMTFILAGTER